MIPYSCQSINEDDIEAVVEALKSSHLTQGERVLEFEKALCEYVGVKHAVTFNSATSALHSAYIAAEIGIDDEVITTPISFVATSNMFVELGAKPIWCDVKLDGNIDERFIERLITSKTKAIVPVDFAGKSVEMEKILQIASKHNLMVIDDASHALGAEFSGKKVGSMADMSIFSFHAIKPITTAEGGAVVTNSNELAKKLIKIRSHGIVKKTLWNSDMDSMGYNYRLSDVAASLGVSQLKRLDAFIQKREQIAQIYAEAFKNSKLFTFAFFGTTVKSLLFLNA
ncbi:MAG: aminotransferase class I/II-fold pyridoxal phosphate-dependent enzyme, partial [Campylobacterota bacterium]|nr:aminotransferase class I/II-fold pyridoxal phosphate-dependent enzyme [Campylobacterota bacterium]